LLIALGANLLSAPLASFAQQQGKVWRVGFLSQRSRPASFQSDVFGAFLEGMSELGYAEGKNLVMEWRFADGDSARLPALANDLVQSKVDIILAAGTPAARAAKNATTSIPIVMASINDPVGLGLVKSLSRPGGNITGLANMSADLVPKQLEMLRRISPNLTRVGFLANPGNPSHAASEEQVRSAAKKIGVNLSSFKAGNPQEIESAFASMAGQKVQGVIIAADQYFRQRRVQLAELSLKHRLLSILPNAEFVEAGGLMSYGSNVLTVYRRAATFVDKILKGSKPSDLPVEQPTKLELIINGKTAKALGIKIPQSLLISADKVIE
jgi:putative ABC transport system substrate-binding protein